MKAVSSQPNPTDLSIQKPDNNMQDSCNRPEASVLLIYTGGTIGMMENPETGALQAFDFAYLSENVPEIKRFGFKIDSIQFDPPMDSAAVNPTLWSQLAETIAEKYDEYDGFVILHGTDTMAYTASALSFMFDGLTKPVVLTGSQLPIGKLRTDGKENLITAIEIAAAGNCYGAVCVPEVCVFFENYLMRGNRSTKVSADQFSAFDTLNYPRLAFACIDIRYEPTYIAHMPPKDKPFEVRTGIDSHVTFLKLFPGISPEVVRATLEIPNLKGVVLETYGSGNAPMEDWFLELIRDAVQRGIVIVNVSQCMIGYVDMDRYETGLRLKEIGVVSGHDLTSECAIVKLMYLFGQGCTHEEVSCLMSISLRGELSNDHIIAQRHYAKSTQTPEAIGI